MVALDPWLGTADDDRAGPAGLVTARRYQLGTRRRLVLLRGGNDLELVVTYLAARAGHHPVILTAPDSAAGLIDRYQPDVVVSTSATGWELDRRGGGGAGGGLPPDMGAFPVASGAP